jgi:hypothetical protein
VKPRKGAVLTTLKILFALAIRRGTTVAIRSRRL